MSDFKSVRQLCEENPNLNNHVLSLADEIDKLEKENQDLVKRHIELENSLIELRAYYKEFDKFVATKVCDLETKLAQAEELRKKDIDELWETRIDPLRFELEDVNKQLDLLRIENSNLSTRTKQLNEVIKNLNTVIDFAVGYISATQPHTDKSPSEVKKWLLGD